ncbi:ADP-ribosylglycohydrolase [Proteiniphilum saccharofermentans]|uniref:ADP-ribosylglycohydrolase n=1 Tax=Proteiniphilum saccharofermentans TaxID=1642647 RepID=A0A1R3T9A1_9BACT|nr:ADP-ribosylglycohydrolase family protein [Proteiniphilum saccharofermentans]SCD21167.1 ADP-ribosylglycohydrolase [Proteiniphilum saccharofermentans]
MLYPTPTIIGAIAGDIIGSVFERNNVKTAKFPLFSDKSDFTDDTVLTVAVADAILHDKDFAETIWKYGRKHPYRGYGGFFIEWLQSENRAPYGSYGNGSAMRVSPVGFAFDTLEEVLDVARQTAEVTHDHPEGIKGAQAVASAVFFARKGKTKDEIKQYITETFGYDLNFTLDEIRSYYTFDTTCQGSVPQAIRAFLESSDYESAIRLAISIGGDSDTIACMTGAIAAAYYKEIPIYILDLVYNILPETFIDVLDLFEKRISSR